MAASLHFHAMSRLLLLSVRSPEVARIEQRDFVRACGLRADELEHRILFEPQDTIGSLDGIDAVLVGGSPYNVLSPNRGPAQTQAHQQLATLVDAPVPTLFVCFGTALVTSLRGGRVGNTHGETTGQTQIELTAAGRRDRLTGALPDSFTALTGHTESVEQVAPDAVVLATGPSCPVQIIRASPTTWACQFHPELDGPSMRTRMDFYRDHGYYSDADRDDIVASLTGVDTRHARQLLRHFIALPDRAEPPTGRR